MEDAPGAALQGPGLSTGPPFLLGQLTDLLLPPGPPAALPPTHATDSMLEMMTPSLQLPGGQPHSGQVGLPPGLQLLPPQLLAGAAAATAALPFSTGLPPLLPEGLDQYGGALQPLDPALLLSTQHQATAGTAAAASGHNEQHQQRWQGRERSVSPPRPQPRPQPQPAAAPRQPPSVEPPSLPSMSNGGAGVGAGRWGEAGPQLLECVGAKERLRWTPELHAAFVRAVDTLGGATKAKPKGILDEMRTPGLSLNHIKSHLQKYRLTEGSLQVEFQLAQQAPGILGQKRVHDEDSALAGAALGGQGLAAASGIFSALPLPPPLEQPCLPVGPLPTQQAAAAADRAAVSGARQATLASWAQPMACTASSPAAASRTEEVMGQRQPAPGALGSGLGLGSGGTAGPGAAAAPVATATAATAAPAMVALAQGAPVAAAAAAAAGGGGAGGAEALVSPQLMQLLSQPLLQREQLGRAQLGGQPGGGLVPPAAPQAGGEGRPSQAELQQRLAALQSALAQHMRAAAALHMDLNLRLQVHMQAQLEFNQQLLLYTEAIRSLAANSVAPLVSEIAALSGLCTQLSSKVPAMRPPPPPPLPPSPPPPPPPQQQQQQQW